MRFFSYGNIDYFEILDDDKHPIVSFNYDKENKELSIREECDGHYEVTINENEINELIERLKKMTAK